jgi:23S rRNA (pseudouridine1915-N3)-methyltransferase
MKITLLVTGKTNERFLKEGIELYTKRLVHYCDFKFIEIPQLKRVKNIEKEVQKILEGEKILAKVSHEKELHLFDEHGTNYSSQEFAVFIEKKMIYGAKELIFAIGGPYGFSDEVYKKAASKISLSRMTFSHQLARLLCTEQIYRAFTIIRGEPYHNE